MTLLPDIAREAKIVSGKDALPLSTQIDLSNTQTHHIHYNNLNQNSAEMSQSNENLNSINNKSHSNKSLIKRKFSFNVNQNNNNNNSSAEFPHLILNDRNRSTSYTRATRSSDYTNMKNLPLATNLFYNWKPVERASTKSVQSKVKIYKPAKRIEMTGRPPSPYKLKVDYETIDSTFHNEKRMLEMKRLQYLKTHTNWSVYPYAGIEEREEYNKKIRDTLKEQMSQRDLQSKKEFEDKIMEYKIVSELDRMNKEEDKRKRLEKYRFLTNYRDENKQLMEDRWMNNYMLKRHEWQQESQLLEQDPVNWSKTLR